MIYDAADYEGMRKAGKVAAEATAFTPSFSMTSFGQKASNA